MYLVFIPMPGENYRRPLRSLLLYMCYVFRALITSLVCELMKVLTFSRLIAVVSVRSGTRSFLLFLLCVSLQSKKNKKKKDGEVERRTRRKKEESVCSWTVTHRQPQKKIEGKQSYLAEIRRVRSFPFAENYQNS